jgi:hypothetical protein
MCGLDVRRCRPCRHREGLVGFRIHGARVHTRDIALWAAFLFIYTAKRGCRRDGLRRMGKGIHTCCGSGEIEKAVGVGYEMRS